MYAGSNRGTIPGPAGRQTMAYADTRTVESEDVERIRDRRRRASERGRWLAVEEMFQAGLRNHWYALAPSSALADARTRSRCGAWGRTSCCGAMRRASTPPVCRLAAPTGAPGCRWVPSWSDRLCCCYHGWAYDGTGQCVAIPSEGGACELAREARVRSYPVEEHGGLIFGYFDDDGRPPDRACPNPDGAGKPRVERFHRPARVARHRLVPRAGEPRRSDPRALPACRHIHHGAWRAAGRDLGRGSAGTGCSSSARARSSSASITAPTISPTGARSMSPIPGRRARAG